MKNVDLISEKFKLELVIPRQDEDKQVEINAILSSLATISE
jgi:hypothetical protein